MTKPTSAYCVLIGHRLPNSIVCMTNSLHTGALVQERYSNIALDQGLSLAD